MEMVTYYTTMLYGEECSNNNVSDIKSVMQYLYDEYSLKYGNAKQLLPTGMHTIILSLDPYTNYMHIISILIHR